MHGFFTLPSLIEYILLMAFFFSLTRAQVYQVHWFFDLAHSLRLPYMHVYADVCMRSGCVFLCGYLSEILG